MTSFQNKSTLFRNPGSNRKHPAQREKPKARFGVLPFPYRGGRAPTEIKIFAINGIYHKFKKIVYC